MKFLLNGGLSGNSYYRGRFSTVDLHVRIACFVKKEKCMFSVLKAAEQN